MHQIQQYASTHWVIWLSDMSVDAEWSYLPRLEFLDATFDGTLTQSIVSPTLQTLALKFLNQHHLPETHFSIKPFVLGSLPCLKELTIMCDRERLTRVRWLLQLLVSHLWKISSINACNLVLILAAQPLPLQPRNSYSISHYQFWAVDLQSRLYLIRSIDMSEASSSQ